MYQDFWNACEIGNIENVKKYVSKIADINQPNSNGWNAIILAAYNHQLEIIKIHSIRHLLGKQDFALQIFTSKRFLFESNINFVQ